MILSGLIQFDLSNILLCRWIGTGIKSCNDNRSPDCQEGGLRNNTRSVNHDFLPHIPPRSVITAKAGNHLFHFRQFSVSFGRGRPKYKYKQEFKIKSFWKGVPSCAHLSKTPVLRYHPVLSIICKGRHGCHICTFARHTGELVVD